MWLGRALGLEPGDALIQLTHDLLAVHDLPGGKLRLALGKSLKPPGGGDGGGWCVVHWVRIWKLDRAIQC
jgi:hypothetical protein